MLRRFPTFQVATTCFSCSPPDVHLLVTNLMFSIHVKKPPKGDNQIAVNNNNNNNYYYYYYYYIFDHISLISPQKEK